jgi:hypothetical protein
MSSVWPLRRRELGAFLRARRARLRPAEVGLPGWGVRRVPGLRREEVAQLWASSDVAGPERRLKRFRHPSAGPLTLHSTSLLMADDPMIRIVILYPATASDAAKLERLS